MDPLREDDPGGSDEDVASSRNAKEEPHASFIKSRGGRVNCSLQAEGETLVGREEQAQTIVYDEEDQASVEHVKHITNPDQYEDSVSETESELREIDEENILPSSESESEGEMSARVAVPDSALKKSKSHAPKLSTAPSNGPPSPGEAGQDKEQGDPVPNLAKSQVTRP